MGMQVAFAGGYTAGHLTPGLALIEAIREDRPDSHCIFLGSESGPEKQLVEREGIPFYALPSLPFSRGHTISKVRSLLRIPRSVYLSIKILRKERVDRLILLGGHVSVAPGIAARILGIPMFLLEPNASFGLASKLLVQHVQALFVSPLFSELLRESIRPQVINTGVPLRKMTLADQGGREDAIPKKPGLQILILGGSLGHSKINMLFPGICGRLKRAGVELTVVHQTGVHGVAEDVSALYESHGITAEVIPYIFAMSEAYAASDIIVTAAGAVTLAELAMAEKPVIIVPLGNAAASHQMENAKTFSDITGARVVPASGNFEEEMFMSVKELLKDEDLRTRRGEAMSAFAKPNAALNILEFLESSVGE